jgi:hypothetical protein
MNFFNYNITINTKLLLKTILIVSVITFILFIIVSYTLLKLLDISIDYNNIFFYQYNKKCQKIIDEYGDCKINKLYLVRQPFGKFVDLAFNLLTLFKYNKYIAESQENYPYHPAFIIEIKKNNQIKFLLLEKNNCINISETFLINKTYDFKRVKINTQTNNNTNKSNNKGFGTRTRTSENNFITLNKILNLTQERIGNHKFFNWNIYKNNCQEFTKEILITINQYTDEHKEFIFRDRIMKLYNPSEFTLHIVNCLFIIINFVEKYIYDSCLFY